MSKLTEDTAELDNAARRLQLYADRIRGALARADYAQALADVAEAEGIVRQLRELL